MSDNEKKIGDILTACEYEMLCEILKKWRPAKRTLEVISSCHPAKWSEEYLAPFLSEMDDCFEEFQSLLNKIDRGAAPPHNPPVGKLTDPMAPGMRVPAGELADPKD